MTAIDHTAYPYLIDLILESCSLRTLITLRATCRSFRDRINAGLVDHAVLLAPATPANDASLHIPSTVNPFKAGAPCIFSLPEHSPRQLATRTLDILSDPPGADRVPEALQSQFTAITTLRRFGPKAMTRPYSALPGPVDTVVDCVQCGPKRAGAHIHLVPGVRRHIIHVLWDEANLVGITPPSDTHTPPAGLEQLTLVLWPFETTRRIRPCNITWLVTALNSFTRFGAQFTIVGLEKVHPSQVLERNVGLLNERGDVATLAEWLDAHHQDAYAGTALQIPHLTLDEWRDSLSDEERDVLCPPGLGNCRPATGVGRR
ncbi:hypothetical protein Q8F55_000046 [Vanrija albida]|uniref:F-box domain-containing protein n=1 Tax=Vanrija albida TaxID=181172 RepID=A0ABR3QCB3_9TREE